MQRHAACSPANQGTNWTGLYVGYLGNLLLYVLQLSLEARGQTAGCRGLILQTLTYRV